MAALLSSFVAPPAAAIESSSRALDPLDANVLMGHVNVLAGPACEGRAAGSVGESRAAAYVIRHLRQAGLEPRLQQVLVDSGTGNNIHALIPGSWPNDVIVIGTHLDHLGFRKVLYPGAEDNASGVAVLIGLAQALASRRWMLARSVLVVFFTGEERELSGSRAFVRAPPVPVSSMSVMLNLDMLGRPLIDQTLLAPLKRPLGIDDRRAVGVLGIGDRPALRRLVDFACAREGVEAVAPEDLPERIETEVNQRALDRGDSVPFESAGVPSVFFGSGESDDYHQPRDTPDRLVPEVLALRARALLSVVLVLSGAPRESFRRVSPTSSARAERASQRYPRAWYVPTGVSGGLAIHPNAPDGAYLGLEGSLVHFSRRSYWWAGIYADMLADSSSDTTRTSVGPEVGLGPVGLDGGYLVEISGSRLRQGFAVRPMLTASWVSITGRVGYLTGHGTQELFGEAGLLFKVPVAIRPISQP